MPDLRIFIRIHILVILFFTVAVHGQVNTANIRKADLLRQDFLLKESLSILKSEERNSSSGKNLHPQLSAALSRYYMTAEDYKKAKLYAEKAYEEGLKTNQPLAKGYGLYAKAYYLYQLDLNEEALAYAKQLHQLVEQHPLDHRDLAAKTYSLLYRLHSQWEDPKTTDLYAEKAIKAAKATGNMDELANDYNSKSSAMGFAYKKLGKEAFADSVRFYLKKAITLYQKNPNDISKRAYAISNLNIANQFYADLQKNHDKSLKDSILTYLENIDGIKNLNDYNYELRANSMGLQAEVALENGDQKRAEQLLLSALINLKSAKKNPANYTIMNVLSALSDLYKKRGDYETALKYSEEKLEYSQKEYDASSAKNAKTLEARFESEKLKSDLALIHSKNRLRSIINYLLGIICVLIFTTLYFTRKNFRNKIKIQKEIEDNLKHEKLQAETRLKLENETKARLLAEQKLLVMEKDKMQREALLNALQVKQKKETLNEIKSQITNEPEHYELQKVLKKDARIEGSIEHTSGSFENIHPEFFHTLVEVSGNRLTEKDKKICAHVFLGLGNKEISEIFNVEPKTIRMSKYRIKQKLQLSADESLEDFLKRL